MTTDQLITSDPADTSRPAFTFTLYLTASTLPLAPTQRVVIVNDPDRLEDLTALYPDAAFWGRAAFWKFVHSLRQELPAAGRAREDAHVDNRRLLIDINNLKIEFGPAAVGLVTGDPLEWFRRVGAVPPRVLTPAERPGMGASEGQAPG